MKIPVFLMACAILLLGTSPKFSQAAVEEIILKRERSSSAVFSTRNGNTNVYNNGGVGNVAQQGYTRLYEKFVLPQYDPSLTLTSALLWMPVTIGNMEVYQTEANWEGFSFYKQPKTIGTMVGRTATSKEKQVPVELTELINKAYQSNTPLAFMMKSEVEGRNWTDSMIFGNGAHTLALTFSSPVPEPESYAMLLAGLGLLGFALRRKQSTS